jgi:TetR/AcrR family transcriptional regulator, cholesterol catabolism regulator
MSMLRNTPHRRKVKRIDESRKGTVVGRSRTERSKRQKRERIMRAARRLFGRKGFERTTTREIAEAADIGAGTLFLYEGTKEDLLVSIFREEIGQVVREALATAPTGPLMERVLHVFGALIAHHEQDPGLARVFVKELPFVEDRRHGVAEMMSGLLGGIAGLIEEAQADREIDPDVPSLQLASNLFALYFSQLQRWLGGDAIDARERDDRLRATLDLQIAGLRRKRSNAVRRDPSSPIFGAEARSQARGG